MPTIIAILKFQTVQPGISQTKTIILLKLFICTFRQGHFLLEFNHLFYDFKTISTNNYLYIIYSC